MYLNYYSKIRNSLTGDIDKEIEKNKGKIVTKIITASNLNLTELDDLFEKGLLTKAYTYNKIVGDVSEMYTEFKIPKASGGYRTINAPSEDLKQAQRKIVELFEKDCKILPHNAAHGYVKYRNTLSEMQTHQKKRSRWFLKLDVKDFFPSCTAELVLEQLDQIHPVSYLPTILLNEIERICMLDGALPQGAPSSPFLSNMVMMDTDYKITQALPTLTYTRYADDMIFSSKSDMSIGFIIGVVKDALPKTMKLNEAKTRYGNCNGRNWNVGLMYNKDLDITVGYRNKKLIKNRIHNFFTKGEGNIDEVRGLLNYYKYIEPVYFNNLIEKFRTKGYNI